MQYRTYKYKEITAYTWTYVKADGSYASFTNKDTLVFASSGAVASYSIDSDYMVSNNSSIVIALPTNAVPGQIIALIDDSGAYDIGVVTSVDNENLKIQYKGLMSLFDVNILNPGRVETIDDAVISYKYNAVAGTGFILGSYFATSNTDKYLRLPLFIRTSGSINAVWDYTGDTVNVKQWLIDLFNSHNVTVKFRLVFESTNRAYIELYISQNTTSARKLLKANISGFKVKHEEETGSDATVCQVLNSSTKALIATYYLLKDNTVTTNASATNRVMPYKLKTATLDVDNDDGVTAEDVAKDNLCNTEYNHYLNISVNKNNKCLPDNLGIGDPVTVVPEIEEMKVSDSIDSNYADKVYYTILTGKKESSNSSDITLILGKSRINYTDLIQMQNMKKVRG